MNAILLALQSPDTDDQSKPDIIRLMGDIASAIGGAAFEPFLPNVLPALSLAGQVILQPYFNEDISIEELQEALLSAWSSLFQSFHHKPTLLLGSLPQIQNIIMKSIKIFGASQTASYALNLVGYVDSRFKFDLKRL